MRNKWFVVGIAVPAVFFGWVTFACLRGGLGIFAIAPAGVAIGLLYGAYRVSKANSFGPQPPMRFDSGTSEAVRRWNVERDAKDAAAKAAAAAAVAKV